MTGQNVEGLAITLRNPHGDGGLIFAFKQVGQSDGFEDVARAYFSVVRFVDEPQG